MEVNCTIHSLILDKPYRTAGSLAAVVTVALTVLVAMSLKLQWGTPSLVGFSTGAGCAVIATAILWGLQCSRKRPESLDELLPLPSSIQGEVASLREKSDRKNFLARYFYSSIQQNDFEDFESLLKLYRKEELTEICTKENIFLSEVDQNSQLPQTTQDGTRPSYKLFEIALMQPDLKFFQKIIELIHVQSISISDPKILKGLWQITNPKLIHLLFLKLDKQSRDDLITAVFDTPILVWAEALMDTPFFTGYYTDCEMLLIVIIYSNLDAAQKWRFLKKAAAIHKIDFNEFSIMKWIPAHTDIHEGKSVLFEAMESNDVLLVQEIVKECPSLLHKSAYHSKVGLNRTFASRERLTPLLYAVFYNLSEIVEILIDYGADKDFISTYGLYFHKQNRLPDPKQVTPLLLAIRCGHVETVKSLLKKGADRSIGDGTSTAETCADEYAKISPRKYQTIAELFKI